MDKKLNILELVEDWLPIHGGVTAVVERFSTALSQFANITIGTVRAKKTKGKNFVDKPSPYKVVRCAGYYNPISNNRESLVALDKKFRKEIESQKYDIIHCHFPLALFKYGKKIGKKQNIPVIITAHSIFYEDVYKATKSKNISSYITKQIVKNINSADEVWVVTNFAKNYLCDFGLTPNAKVVENAVLVPQKTEKIDVRKKYHLENCFVVLSVCRLVKPKNVELLVRSMEKLKNENIKLVVIGSGAQQNNLTKLAEKLNLNNILFLGAVSDQIRDSFYDEANLIAFVSVGDSAGLIQVEASYYQKPTLALENTAISEKIVDGKNGFLTTNNPTQCANKILMCYNNTQLTENAGKQAKTDLFRTYEDKVVVDDLLNQYQQAIFNFGLKKQLQIKQTQKKSQKNLSKNKWPTKKNTF